MEPTESAETRGVERQDFIDVPQKANSTFLIEHSLGSASPLDAKLFIEAWAKSCYDELGRWKQLPLQEIIETS